MRFRFIDNHRGIWPLYLMCRVLKVTAQGYYNWKNSPESRRSKANRQLLTEIRMAHAASRQTYGSTRIHAELIASGIECSRGRVARLMRANRIRARHKRKFRVTTDSRHKLPVAANVLERNFLQKESNAVWAADITYIPTREGWLYLAAVLDLHSRKIVGWAMEGRMSADLTVRALDMALAQRNPGAELLHHSDRGSQYAAMEYQEMLNRHGITVSISRKRDCWDNAPMESFFGKLKTELVHHKDYKTHKEAKADVFDYIEVFYNRQRRHSSLGYLSPADFEAKEKVA